MSIDLSDVHADLSAFADDDEDVIIQPDGQCLFIRGGSEIAFKLIEDSDGRSIVEFDSERMTYRRFLSHYLAGLPVLAEGSSPSVSPFRRMSTARARSRVRLNRRNKAPRLGCS